MCYANTPVGNGCMHNIQSRKITKFQNPNMESINLWGKIKVSHNLDLSLDGNP